jgi:DNA topoisomerase-2
LTRDFYNLAEFNAWSASGAGAGWRVKYYKGLGTWTQSDAKALLTTTPSIKLLGDDDADDAMALAFDKKKADNRKQWILNSVAVPPVPDYSKHMTISAFVNTDLVNFSRYDTERSLPSMLDGLKTSQRKILFTVLQRNYIGASREVKVAQLSGAVAELTLYLHGEQSLNDAIVNMAQDFMGSNNLPLLFPDGAFGTRLGNGKDAASPRYIYTYAQDVTRLLFRSDDDTLLVRKKEEGFDVEPESFWPVLPMLLINGSTGIGTGFSTSVTMFSPKDVKANVLRFLDGEAMEDMTPHFAGFKGTVVEVASGKWVARGVATRDAAHPARVRITELPPSICFNKYEEWIGEDKSPVALVSNKSSDVAADFVVDYKSGAAPEDAVKLLKELNLVDNISASNMYAFDEHGALKKYDTAEAMMREWCAWRQNKYEVRRTHLVATLEHRALVAQNRSRFCKAVATQKLVLGSMEESALCELLRNKGFKEVDGNYDYLLNMHARSFTSDRAAALQASAEAAEAEAQRMRETTAKALWREDLARLTF